MSNRKIPGLPEVKEAAERIAPYVLQTPLLLSEDVAEETGAASVGLKLEMMQPTGSFKVRGAANRICSLTDEEKKRGVITFSTGNHGKAVSYIAQKAGVKAVVCLSKRVPAYRIEAIRALGALPEVYGDSQDEAEERYYELMESEGYLPVVPFDDPFVVAGQGTIALEILKQAPETDMILVPLSGGGLLSGIAMAAKALNPTIKIVGVSIENSPVMLRCVEAGRPVELPETDSIADSLLGGIGKENDITFPMVRDFVDEHVIVCEADLKRGMHFAFSHHGLVIEGASASSLGAMLHEKINAAGKHVVFPITGRNVDVRQYLSLISEEAK